MSRETEFIQRHTDDCRRGAELCRILQGNANQPSSRELHYLELMTICKRLEGTCRQMAHERGDDFRWLTLGNHYFKVGEMVRKVRRRNDWMRFGQLADVFMVGIEKIKLLATTATGLSSMNASSLLILPPHLRPKPGGGIILPS